MSIRGSLPHLAIPGQCGITSYDFDPTGNAPNGQGQLTQAELGNLLRQYGVPFDDGNLDFFQSDGSIRNSDSGRAIQPLGRSDLYALIGSGAARAGGLALTPGQLAANLSSAALTGNVPVSLRFSAEQSSVLSTLGRVGCVTGHVGEGILHLGEGGTFVAAAIAAPIAVAGLAPEVAPVTVPASIAAISVPIAAGGVALIGTGARSFAGVTEC